MPCWFFEKRDLQNTPSFRDGINADTESRYRRDGARFIISAGDKMGLRYDTCATGVVYFHRFYLFHSFKEFHRYVMAACCLFLAGKVEETPKKCKDLIKITRSLLSDVHFNAFGSDPREEVMTLERILLQTIKFDLMVEHPYAYVLKFAKLIKGDKAKVQKMAQMAWTFVNDSLCTTLSLQWEPEVVAVAMMYLTSRLNKIDITDWQDKPSGYRGKWYESLVTDVTLELLEDICHQVLDLYSKPPQKGFDSPVAVRHPQPSSTEDVSRSTPKTPKSPQVVKRTGVSSAGSSGSSSAHPVEASQSHPQQESPSVRSASQAGQGQTPQTRLPAVLPTATSTPVIVTPSQPQTVSTLYSHANPYIATQMYASSFMSQEGSKSIQSLIGIQPPRVVIDDYSKPQAAHSVQAGPVATPALPPPAYQQVSAGQYASSAAPYQQQQQQPVAPNYQQPPPQIAAGHQPHSQFAPPPSGAPPVYGQPPYAYGNQYKPPPQQPAPGSDRTGYGQSYPVQGGSNQQYRPGAGHTGPSAGGSYHPYPTDARPQHIPPRPQDQNSGNHMGGSSSGRSNNRQQWN